MTGFYRTLEIVVRGLFLKVSSGVTLAIEVFGEAAFPRIGAQVARSSISLEVFGRKSDLPLINGRYNTLNTSTCFSVQVVK